MPRYFIEVSYKGTHFSGFQSQRNAVTIQGEVEKSLQIFFRKHFILTGASRTDAGVHALQNFFHFDSMEDLLEVPGLNQNQKKILYALNSIIATDVVVKNLFKVQDQAHCRFDAVSREYKYLIYQKRNPFLKETAYYYPYRINLSLLQSASQLISVTKDFTSFSKKNTQVKSFICNIIKSDWTFENGFLVYNIIANRFLRGMVRGLVATMLQTACGKISLNHFKSIIENKNSSHTDFSAPPQGLFLKQIVYKKLEQAV